MVMRPLVAAERAVLEEQRRVLADAAHELRTPVAVLRSELDAARAAGGDPAALRTAVAACEREAAQLGHLVDDLLFLARTDALPPLARTRVFLDDIAQQAIGRLRRLPIAADRTITVDEFEATPVLGDPLLLERAMVVLLENALVHGGTGPIVLTAGPHDGQARLTVRDHGPGIPPGQAEAIFERFHQVDASRQGAGLGLPIARWIAERHGGTLAVENASPGARFLLTIPAA
jgi:two-component system OmpR family sensor kinase